MGLVEDEGGVLLEIPVALGFGEQDAVGHELDPGGGAQALFEAHLIAHQVAQRHLQFLRHPPRHAGGRDPARLGAADPAAGVIAQGFRHHFRELRGLARAGLADDDDHLMLAHGRNDFLPVFHHR